MFIGVNHRATTTSRSNTQSPITRSVKVWLEFEAVEQLDGLNNV